MEKKENTTKLTQYEGAILLPFYQKDEGSFIFLLLKESL